MSNKKTLLIVVMSLILIWVASKVPVWMNIAVNFGGTMHVIVLYILIGLAYAIPFVLASIYLNETEKMSLMNRSFIYLLLTTGLYTAYSIFLSSNAYASNQVITFFITFLYLFVVGGLAYVISYYLMKSRMN